MRRPDLAELIRAIDAIRTADGVPAIPRLRFVTSHPWDLSDRLIAAMAECPSICTHLHLPVQSGDDAVLRRRISITLTGEAPPLSDLLGALHERGVRADATEYEKNLGERRVRVTLEALVPLGEREHLVEIFEALPGIERVRIEPLG